MGEWGNGACPIGPFRMPALFQMQALDERASPANLCSAAMPDEDVSTRVQLHDTFKLRCNQSPAGANCLERCLGRGGSVSTSLAEADRLLGPQAE
jgi:hypothetical protein